MSNSSGFNGSATTIDQCRCDNGTIAYENGKAMCVPPGYIFNRFIMNWNRQCLSGQQYLCSSVTTDYNFVSCINNDCTCNAGFTGSATLNDQCRCVGTVVQSNGQAVCVPPRYRNSSLSFDILQRLFARCTISL
jgi:hypothetical protein